VLTPAVEVAVGVGVACVVELFRVGGFSFSVGALLCCLIFVGVFFCFYSYFFGGIFVYCLV